ncbi:MAG TPA: glycine/sarcosine/betaine reductase selenoprotein B family protein [Syntrophales bacterium]
MSIKTEKDKLIAVLFEKHPALVDKWAKSAPIIINTTVPWSPVAGNPAEGPIALVTTAGIHLKSQTPFDMEDSEGDSSFRVIPSSSFTEDLAITHNYYDHGDADADVNVVFPIERLNELCAEGTVGQVAPRHFSFMGHIQGRHLARLIGQTAPIVAAELKKDGVRAVLLTPA